VARAESASGGQLSWHERSAEETLALLETSRAGLTAEEAERRRARYGRNELQVPPPRSALRAFVAQFADFLILILIAAAVVAGLIGDLIDTFVIVAIVVLNATIGFVQEIRAERAMAALKAMAAPTATVLRQGTPSTIAAAQLVPGDAVVLEAGRIVPADLRVAASAWKARPHWVETDQIVTVDTRERAIRHLATITNPANGCPSANAPTIENAAMMSAANRPANVPRSVRPTRMLPINARPHRQTVHPRSGSPTGGSLMMCQTVNPGSGP